MKGHLWLNMCSQEATALREVGRVERTLFMIDWILDAELQRRASPLIASKAYVASKLKFQALEHMLSSRYVSRESRVQVP